MTLEAGMALYVAMAVALAVWIGIFVYLWRIDAQARELRRKLDRLPIPDQQAVTTATLHVQRPSAAVGRQPAELVDSE